MSLDPGTRFGPYEILGPLGAGGMGEVYRAKDTRLDRSVAIKVLPSDLAPSPEVRARFEREARAISALNHPHICTLYDVGHQDGTDFLVMEYLEGETLAARLERGPVPPAELLRIGVQMADALEKAHRAGLIHRDLKPGNVMLTKAGSKLLDFGLARAAGLAPAPTGLSQSPTVSRPLTAEGTIVGTFQYMAPEVLEGTEADARSDIWGLGAVLYEMATGRKAFEGKSQASLIGAIMSQEPRPVADLQPLAPPGLDRTIRQCLAKDPDDRIQTAHDVRLQLEWLVEGGSQAGIPAPVAARRRSRERVTLGIAVASAAVAVAAIAWIVLHRPAPPEILRFEYLPPRTVQFVDAPRVSPDGRFVAYNATDSTGVSRVWLRSMAGVSPQPLSGTDGASRPFWSPDSRHLAFFAGGKLKKVAVTGGPPVLICDAGTGADGSWGNKDVIVFDGAGADPLRRVAAGGGAVTVAALADSAAGERNVGWPEFLPDGRHFVYLATGSTAQLKLASLDAKETHVLFPCDSRAQYAAPGYLLFSRGGTLVAQGFDARAGKTRGDPVPVAEQVTTNAVGGADFSVSANGVLAYSGRGGQLGQLVKLDRAGRVQATLSGAADMLHPALSPDEQRVAVRMRDLQTRTRDIWVIDLARAVASRLTFEPSNENDPVWSPAGDRVAYDSEAPENPGIYARPSSGAGQSELLLASSDQPNAGDWSRDGAVLLYRVISPRTQSDIWVLPMTGERKPYPFLSGPYNEGQARISPDGRWVAYTSDESGREEVYVQSFPQAGGKWQVSTRGGSDPAWRGDGRELFYLSPDQQMMAMPVASSSAFQVTVPQPLFQAKVLLPTGPRNHYAVTRDGQTFYVVSPMEGQSFGTTTVVMNWDAELRRK